MITTVSAALQWVTEVDGLHAALHAEITDVSEQEEMLEIIFLIAPLV